MSTIGRISVSLFTVVAVISIVLAAAVIWLFLTQPVTVANAVNDGEISPLVHTKYGYHVLRLDAREPERQQTWEEVREKLTASMREQWVSNQRRDLINQLNNEKVDINPATMDTLRDRYDKDGNIKVASGPPAPAGSPSPAPAPPKKP